MNPLQVIAVEIGENVFRRGMEGARATADTILREAAQGHQVRLTFAREVGDDTSAAFLRRGDVRLFAAAVLLIDVQQLATALCRESLRKWVRVAWVGVDTLVAHRHADDAAIMDDVLRIATYVIETGPEGQTPFPPGYQAQTQSFLNHLCQGLAQVGWSDSSAQFTFAGGWISRRGCGLIETLLHHHQPLQDR